MRKVLFTESQIKYILNEFSYISDKPGSGDVPENAYGTQNATGEIDDKGDYSNPTIPEKIKRAPSVYGFRRASNRVCETEDKGKKPVMSPLERAKLSSLDNSGSKHQEIINSLVNGENVSNGTLKKRKHDIASDCSTDAEKKALKSIGSAQQRRQNPTTQQNQINVTTQVVKSFNDNKSHHKEGEVQIRYEY